jgi:predicted ATPase
LAQLVDSGLAFQQGTPPDAVYTFKHALVQDAAYNSLLRRHRQELHGRIAKVIEEHWPDTEATEPELLAHHYTEAKQPAKAIQLWRKAGSLALKRMALADRGLDLVAALPPSQQRDRSELDLRSCRAPRGSRSEAGQRRRSGTACSRRWTSRTRFAALKLWCRSSGDCSAMCSPGGEWPSRCAGSRS